MISGVLSVGNDRQQMLVCAKIISSMVRKALSIANAHMSLGTPQGALAAAALAVGVSPVSILQVGDLARVTTPARLCFATYITTTDHYQDLVWHALLGLSE